MDDRRQTRGVFQNPILIAFQDLVISVVSMIDTSKMKQGVIYLINGKQYAKCAGCNKVVRVDKFLLGSIHFCD